MAYQRRTSNKSAASMRRARARAWARAILRLESLEDRTLLSTVHWIGGSGNWNTAANWDTGSLPGANDDVVIDMPSALVTHNSATHSVQSLAILNATAALDLSGGVLNVSNTVDVVGAFNLKGGTLGNGQLTSASTIKATSGTLSAVTVNGSLDMSSSSGTVHATGGLILNGTALLGNASGSTNGNLHFQGGTQTLGGTGTVLFGGSGSNDLYVDGTGAALTIGAGVTIRGKTGHIGASGSGTPVFVNQGTIVADTAGGTLYVGYSGTNQWTNHGIVSATAGTSVILDATWSNAQSLAVTGGGTMTLQGTWSNSGTIATTNSTLNLKGTFKTADIGDINRVGGTVVLAGVLDNTASTLALNAKTGSWVINTATILGGTVTMMDGAILKSTVAAGGTLNGVVVNGVLDVTTSLSFLTVKNGLTLNGTVYLGDSAHSNGIRFEGTQTLIGSGSIVFKSSNTVYTHNIYVTGAEAVLTIGPGITIRGSKGYVRNESSSPTATFINRGTIVADVADMFGGAITIDAPSWKNLGTIESQGGTIQIGANGIASDGSAIVSSYATGLVHVAGNVLGTTTNADRYAAHGKLLFNGQGTPASPQLLEVMSEDLGADPKGFANNFAYGSVALGGTTYVRLVDQSSNSDGAGPEALYVNSLLVPTGTTLGLNGFKLYARDVQLDGVIVNGTVVLIPPGAFDLSTPVPGQIGSDGEVDRWTFYGRAGQGIGVVLSTGIAGTPQPLQPYLNFGTVRLLGPGGNVLAEGTNSQSGANVSLPKVTLPMDGTYRVEVLAGQAGSKGHYVFTAWDSTVIKHALPVNQTLNGTIPAPYREEHWEFSAAAGSQIKFDFLTASTSAIEFDLVGPTGTLFTGLSGDSQLLSLADDGKYLLKAYGVGGVTGSYAFKVIETSQTELTLGSSFQGSLPGSEYARLFTVKLSEAQPLVVTLGGETATDHVELYAKLGGPPTRSDKTFSSTGAGSDQLIAIPSAPAGTWYILVYGDHVAAPPSAYTLSLSPAGSVALAQVTPDHHGTAADAVLTLIGGGFDKTTMVSLVASGGPTYIADATLFDAPDRLTAKFLAGHVPHGVYTVRVRRSDGSVASLPSAFTFTAGGQAKLETSIVVPSQLGNHAPATIYVNYANTGDVAMQAPLLVLNALRNGKPGALLTLDESKMGVGLWTSSVPDGFTESIQIIASGATPGLLQPGESLEVPVFYAGWREPWIGNKLNFDLTIHKADNATPIDWDELKETLRPSTIPADAWDVIYTNLTAQVGDTWGGYAATLASNAEYLGHLGQNVTDAGQLWNFQVQQAIGFSPVSSLENTVDLEIAQPGLALSVGRYFSPSLAGRHQMSVFGRGWTLSGGWLRSLTVEEDGTVAITDTNVSQRRFQPKNTGGGYFSQPGDYGVLTKLTGNAFKLQERDGIVTRFNAAGQAEYVEDTNGNRITTEFTAGRLTKLMHSSGAFITIGYNAAGRISQLTDSGGRTVVYSYDGSTEHLTSVQSPNGLVTQYVYDSSGNPTRKHALVEVQYPGNAHLYLTYDPNGRIRQMYRDGNADRVTFSYGPAGTVTLTDNAGNATEFHYDARYLLAKIEDPLNHATFFAHDNAFNLTQVTDTMGQSYLLGYDTKGNVTKVADPLGYTVGFSYGAFNRLTQVTDQNGNPINYAYDAKGNLLYTTYADNSLEQIVNDAFGNPITWTNRRGTPIQYQRDAAGRITRVTYAGGSTLEYAYDPVWGQLTSAKDASGTTTLTYDPLHPDWLKRITYPNGRYLEYQYDAAGRRTQMVDQDGFTVNYTYDAAGRLKELLDRQSALIVRYTYDPASSVSRLIRKDMGNGTHTTYAYTAAGQAQSIVNHAPDGSVNSRFDYVYDVLSRIGSMTTIHGVWTYAYDSTGQLTHAVFESNDPGHIPDQDLTYVYDGAGNRTKTIINGVTVEYMVNGLNQYLTVGNDVYGFDKDGNLVSKQTADGLETFMYSDDNRLVGVVTPAGTWEYQYDALGNRVASFFNGQKTEYVVDPFGLGDVVAEYGAAGSLLAHYIHGAGLTSQVSSSGTTAYYDFDLIGSTAGMTDASGDYVNEYSFLPFGELQASDEMLSNPFGFVGEFGVIQEANGLDFMRARFYATGLGRFINVDPLGIAGGDANLYTYASNNSIDVSDPTGLSSWCPIRIGLKYGYKCGRLFPAGPEIQIPFCAWYIYKAVGEIHDRCDSPPPATPPDPSGGDPGGDENSSSASSTDPNEKTGPAGFGTLHFIAPERLVPYRIDFENDATATAPAQRVDISDQLDAKLEWATFELTEIGFGDFIVTVPSGVQHYQTEVTMTFNDQTFIVYVEAGFDSETGKVFAIFQTIDPFTNLPPDVLTGFLPPEDGSGRGMGHISFTIRPKTGLPSGTQIRNVAYITFDFGETIATNQIDPHDPSKGADPNKEALITIDALPPMSTVNALPVNSLPVFVLSWGGTDDAGGSGIAYYDIYVSDNGGLFEPFLLGTTTTMAILQRKVGHTYSFYSVATDNVGHRQPTPETGQAFTTVLAFAPSFRVTVLATQVHSGQPFSVSVTALDADGNTLTNYAGTVHFASSDLKAVLPNDYRFMPADAGVHKFDGLKFFASPFASQILLVSDAVSAVQGFTTVKVVPAMNGSLELEERDPQSWYLPLPAPRFLPEKCRSTSQPEDALPLQLVADSSDVRGSLYNLVSPSSMTRWPSMLDQPSHPSMASIAHESDARRQSPAWSRSIWRRTLRYSCDPIEVTACLIEPLVGEQETLKYGIGK